MSVRRQVKNVVKNYSHAEVLVREATSNDPWGPSSSVMTEIADATYNVVAFSEIMGMIWKRLNDHGKNWRHVYKSLVVLDYIIKTGSERVAQQCRENIFAIQTLKDFQFVDKDGKDQGMNVREKAKQLVALLKDEDRMKTERSRALKAKERFAQASSGIGSDTSRHLNLKTSGSASDIRSDGFSALPATSTSASRSWEPERKVVNNEIENCRPSNSNEEELQLQLALALSKQEAAETTKFDQRENERIQMAINKSQSSPANVSGSMPAQDPWGSTQATPAPQSDPWGAGAAAGAAAAVADPWAGTPAVSQSQPQFSAAPDPWGAPQPAASLPAADPWGSTVSSAPAPAPAPTDPWGAQFGQPQTQPPVSQPDPWGAPGAAPGATQFNGFNSGVVQQNQPFSTAPSSAPPTDLFDLGAVGQALPAQSTEKPKPKLDADLAGLVDLGSLTTKEESRNPFLSSNQLDSSKSTNPFKQEKPQQPTLNQLRVTGPATMAPPSYPAGNDMLLPAPLVPNSSGASSTSNNPFL